MTKEKLPDPKEVQEALKLIRQCEVLNEAFRKARKFKTQEDREREEIRDEYYKRVNEEMWGHWHDNKGY